MEKRTLVPRRWWQRGHADHGWLKSFHTFSFASYFDPAYMSFGPLRVINEDRVAPTTGFPTHPHANAEIFSYIIEGELTHRDSMGNVETLRRGEVQFTSAGTGIRHSEYNAHKKRECHFLQIWYIPSEKNLEPKYYTLPQTSDDEKRNRLLTLIRSSTTFSDEELKKTGLLAQGRAIPAHCNLTTRASILSPGATPLRHRVGSESGVDEHGMERWIYVHVAMTSGYRDARLFQRSIALKTAEGQTHEKRLEHAANFLQGVYDGQRPFWSPSDSSGRQQQPRAELASDRPRVTLTFAQSLDAKIAGEGRKMLPLSGPESMVMTHTLRTMHDGILVGVGTLLNDNPQLNARLLTPLSPPSKERAVPVDQWPRPIVLDSSLQTPLDCKLITNFANGFGKAPLIVHESSPASSVKAQKLKESGAQLVAVSDTRNWDEVLRSIKKEAGLHNVMVEGGASIISSLLEQEQLVDKVIVTVSTRDMVGEKGLGYGAGPSWLRTGSPQSLARKPSDGSKSSTMHSVTLTPEPFGKDLVFAWSRSAPLLATARVRVKLASIDKEATLEEGDGIFIKGCRIGQDEIVLENAGERDAELILFDVEPGNQDADDDDDDDDDDEWDD